MVITENPMVLQRLFSAAALAIAVGATSWVQAGPPEDAVNAQMRVVLGFEMLKKGQAFSGPDKVPPNFLTAIQGKRLVGLGEATHGTSEVYTMIGNTILTMAKQGKVVVFWEDSTASVMAVNDWIHGLGTENDLGTVMFRSIYRVRDTLEVAEFLKAARRFNSTAPADRKIDIYGIDPNMYGGIPGTPSPTDVTIPLLAFSTANQLGLDTQLAACSAYLNDPGAYSPAGRAAAAAAAIQIQLKVAEVPSGVSGQVISLVMANDLVANMQAELAYTNTFGSVYLDMFGSTPSVPHVNTVRDACMAQNIKTLMDAIIPTSGTGIYWGHNAHVGRLSFLNGDPKVGSPSAWSSTGSILALWLGDAYYPVATMIGKGTILVQVIEADGTYGGFQNITAPAPVDRDSLNAIAATVFPTKPVFFSMQESSFRWFSRPELAIGSIVELPDLTKNVVKTIPGMSYGAVISFPYSNAAHARK